MLAHSPAYAQAYQEARSWGIGGSKSRALSAAETLITGALGGQGDLQLAANTLAPYAAAAIGKRFGHGEHKNEAAQAIGHFMLGAALAYANGADPLAGGSAAVAAERAAEYLAKQYDDGHTAIDPISGQFNPNLLPEHIKEEIKAQTGAIASVVGAAGGSLNGTNSGNGALFDAQVGGVLGQNAVENNYLDYKQLIKIDKEYISCNGDELCKQQVIDSAKLLSHQQDMRLSLEKAKCMVGICDGLHLMNKRWVESIGIHNVVRELRQYYPNVPDWALLEMAKRYAAEADDSYNQGTKRTIIGFLNDSPALGLANSGIKSGVKGFTGLVRKITPKKAVPVGEARIPPSPQAVKGTTVTLSQEQRLANGEVMPKGSVVTWSDNAVKVVRPDGKKRRFNSRDWEQKALPRKDLGVAQTRINIARGRTRTTPVRDNGKPVSAGFDHVLDGHFNRPVERSRSIFTVSPSDLKTILQNKRVVSSPIQAIQGGQYVRIVDTGRVIGKTSLKEGGRDTRYIKIFTDRSGNLITTYPVKGN